jgi:hypothetical protein
MYSLDEVFNQADADDSCGYLDAKGYEARIDMGAKIVRDTETREVQILNTSYGEHYREIMPLEYAFFRAKGWRIGILSLHLSNSRRKLDNIDRKIKIEINNRANTKQINRLQKNRDRVMVKYREISNNLNLLNNG